MCKFSIPGRQECAELSNRVKSRAEDFTSYTMERARGFNLLDYTMFKAVLLSFGVLIGARFSAFFHKHRFFILLSFIGSYTYLIWRIFLRRED